jgi:hypothetical protein
VTIKTHTTYEYEGFEFDVEPYEDSIQVKETEDGFTVGYLVQDDSPGDWNDGDGIGDIYFGSNRYTTFKKYLEILGLDRYGDKDEDVEPNPDAVLLSVYEHGGMMLSIMGEGMQCQWDTANGGAVWVPDKYLIEEVAGLDEEARHEKMVEFARQAIETYNVYEHGDIWDICIREYDIDKTFAKEHEMCWGFVGYKYAIEELKSSLAYLAKAESESRLESK